MNYFVELVGFTKYILFRFLRGFVPFQFKGSILSLAFKVRVSPEQEINETFRTRSSLGYFLAVVIFFCGR